MLKRLFGNTHKEVDEELAHHLEHETEANLAKGMSPAEARRQANIALGGVERTREQIRETRPTYWLETFAQDLRYAVRGLRRNPVFTTTVILTLMLGIGATTAVFSVVDRILFRPLPYADGSRLVSVGLTAPIEPQEFMLGGSYFDWRDNQQPFTALTSETGTNTCDLTGDQPLRLNCAFVEASFLPTLGVAPIVGRNFSAAEDSPNGPKVALISYALWQTRFNRDSNVAGKILHLDGTAFEVIGVLPRTFEMPRLQAADVLQPQALDAAAQRRAIPGRPMWAFARLKPGISIEQAKAQLQPLFDYSLRLAPAQFRKEVHLQVRSLRDRQVKEVRRTAWVLFGLVIAVLFIACANVTSLLMARGAGRERELAVRSALGAGRLRLVRQALTESLVLALAGTAAGYAFAEALLQAFRLIAPRGMPFLAQAHIDARILAFSVLCALLCAAVFGLAPALQKPRAQALAGRTRSTPSQARLRQALVVAQIAASMVLLVCGALLARSFSHLQNQSIGLQSHNVVTASITLGRRAYPTAPLQMAFFDQLEHNLRFGPGVTSLALSDTLPPGGNHHDQIFASIAAGGRPKLASGTGGNIAWRWVTPEYFRALGIPILRGRAFTEDERNSSGHFVVLSSLLATRLFPGTNPVGERVQLAAGAPDAQNPWYTITGIAADVKNGGLAGGDEPEYYRLRRNVPDDWDRSGIFTLETTLPPATIETWIRTQTAAIDTTVPVDLQTLSERVSKLADQPRFETLLVTFFACTGLLLAIVGLYGVISFLVVQRTHEIGVRMALGATRANILRLVMGGGGRLILAGTLLGLTLSVFASRALAGLLYKTHPYDPLAFVCVTLALVLIAAAATFLPAASATAVNPTEALRCD